MRRRSATWTARPWGQGPGSRPACGRFAKRCTSPIAAKKLAATIALTPGTVISRLISALSKSDLSDQLLHLGDLLIEELDLANAARQRSRAPRAPARARRATRGPSRRTGPRPEDARSAGASARRGSRSSRACGRARAGRAATAAGASPTWQRSGTQTASSSPAASSFASVRASRRSVFARAWRIPVSPGETTITRATCRLEDPRDLPRVRCHLQRHTVIRREALSEQLKTLGRGLDPPGRADAPALADRDLAEIQMHVQPDSSHLHHPSCRSTRRRTGGQTTSTDPRSKRTWTSRRGGQRKARARSPSRKNGLPSLRSPKGPCPSHPDPTGRALRQQPQRRFSCPEDGSPSRAPARA